MLVIRRSIGLGICVLVLAAAACGDEVTVEPTVDDDGVGGVGGTGGDAAGPGGGGSSAGGTGGTLTTGSGGAQPPPPPSESAPFESPGRAYVVQTVALGATGDAWKDLGYNIDDVISDGSGNAECMPFGGANPAAVHVDGHAGRDNSFGNNLLPIFTNLSSSLQQDVDATLAAGEDNSVIHLPELGGEPDYLGLDARVYFGTLSGTPSFDGSDVWPVASESLSSPPELSSAKLADAAAYANQHTFVIRPEAGFELTLSLLDESWVLPMSAAIITGELSPDRSSVTGGVIAGVLDTEAFIESFQKVAGAFDPSLCEGTTLESIADQLRQASDVMLDGSQDSSAVCNGISIGLGFEAVETSLGSVAAPVPPEPDPCAN